MGKAFRVERDILIYSIRYALGRQTFAPSVVVDNVLHNVNEFESYEIELMIKDVQNHGKMFGYGMGCDEETWMGFIEKLSKELKRREWDGCIS